jgi:hypothetical protein
MSFRCFTHWVPGNVPENSSRFRHSGHYLSCPRVRERKALVSLSFLILRARSRGHR